MKFKPMHDDSYYGGGKMDFLAIAALDFDAMERLAKQGLILSGHSIPFEPVLEVVPEIPPVEKADYYKIHIAWEGYNNTDLSLAFVNSSDADSVLSAILAASGPVYYLYYNGVQTNPLKETSVMRFSEDVPTPGQAQAKKEANAAKERNDALLKAYKETCKDLDESREWIYGLRNDALNLVNRFDRLARAYAATHSITGNPDMTMKLLAKDYPDDMLALGEQIEGFKQDTEESELTNLEVILKDVVHARAVSLGLIG